MIKHKQMKQKISISHFIMITDMVNQIQQSLPCQRINPSTFSVQKFLIFFMKMYWKIICLKYQSIFLGTIQLISPFITKDIITGETTRMDVTFLDMPPRGHFILFILFFSCNQNLMEKYCSVAIWFLITRWLQTFAHGTTAQMSCKTIFPLNLNNKRNKLLWNGLHDAKAFSETA